MSRVNIGAKPYIMPMPVLIISSYDEEEKPCAMLAVWGGITIKLPRPIEDVDL